MYIILWQYRVKEAARKEFESIYSPQGAWAMLFKKSGGFLETELLQNQNDSELFLTIDRWESRESYEAFHAQWETEYRNLDAQCENLTESESPLGAWVSIER